jgi:PAS domain S-box-containing protein
LTDQDGAGTAWRFQTTLLDGMDEAAIATDLEGRVTLWNRAAEALYGWQSAEVLGRPIRALVGADLSAEQASLIATQRRAGQAWTDELRVARKDGSTFLAHVRDTPARDADGRLIGMIGVSYDLAQLGRVQSALHDREWQLDQSQRVAHIGTWQWDVATQHLTWSDEQYRQFGREPQPGPPDDAEATRRIHPDDLPTLRSLYAAAVVQRSSFALELRLRWPDGTIRWIRCYGQFVADAAGTGRVVGTSLDVTERKAAEQALRTSDERLRTVLDNAAVILTAVDRDGRCTLRPGRGLTGLTGLSGLPSTSHPEPSASNVNEQQAQVLANVRRALTGESFSGTLEVDGHIFECVYRPILDSEGVVDGAVGVATDVTERELARRDLGRLQHQYELILQSAGDGIYGQDRRGTTTFVNPAAARMLGWSAEDLVGRDMHTTLHGTRADGSPYPVEDCPIHASVADGCVHHATGELFTRQNGTRFPVEYTCTPMRASKRIIGAVVTFRDVSVRRTAEEERPRPCAKRLERDELARLTSRELDVLRKLARGQTNVEIALALGLVTGTIKSHVEHLLKKLGLANRTQAAVWAARLDRQR